jgi:hypothetical protein
MFQSCPSPPDHHPTSPEEPPERFAALRRGQMGLGNFCGPAHTDSFLLRCHLLNFLHLKKVFLSFPTNQNNDPSTSAHRHTFSWNNSSRRFRFSSADTPFFGCRGEGNHEISIVRKQQRQITPFFDLNKEHNTEGGIRNARETQ